MRRRARDGLSVRSRPWLSVVGGACRLPCSVCVQCIGRWVCARPCVCALNVCGCWHVWCECRACGQPLIVCPCTCAIAACRLSCWRGAVRPVCWSELACSDMRCFALNCWLVPRATVYCLAWHMCCVAKRCVAVIRWPLPLCMLVLRCIALRGCGLSCWLCFWLSCSGVV